MDYRELLFKLQSFLQKQKEKGFENPEFKEKKPRRKFHGKTLLVLPLVIVAVYAILSCQYTVEETEQAVVTTLGKVTSVETAGLHFKLPYPIQGVTKVRSKQNSKISRLVTRAAARVKATQIIPRCLMKQK